MVSLNFRLPSHQHFHIRRLQLEGIIHSSSPLNVFPASVNTVVLLAARHDSLFLCIKKDHAPWRLHRRNRGICVRFFLITPRSRPCGYPTLNHLRIHEGIILTNTLIGCLVDVWVWYLGIMSWAPYPFCCHFRCLANLS